MKIITAIFIFEKFLYPIDNSNIVKNRQDTVHEQLNDSSINNIPCVRTQKCCVRTQKYRVRPQRYK